MTPGWYWILEEEAVPAVVEVWEDEHRRLMVRGDCLSDYPETTKFVGPLEAGAETQESVSEWRRSVFGRGDWGKVLGRMVEEVRELAVLAGCPDAAAHLRAASLDLMIDGLGHPCHLAAGELADVLVVLYGVAAEAGVDLQAALNAKMAVNRARKWRVDGPGLGRHE